MSLEAVIVIHWPVPVVLEIPVVDNRPFSFTAGMLYKEHASSKKD
jgi:hypothetical protein